MKGLTFGTSEEPERALLVAVEPQHSRDNWSAKDSLEELGRLANTAGAVVVGAEFQRMTKPSGTHYVGRGKLEELVALKTSLEYDLVVCDDELSPRQQRALEEELGTRVIDRTALILDIFAGQARTREGKLQVELAQHRYLLPRLIGKWAHLERLGGGIGTRGPGESQLETDRRLIRGHIQRLEADLEAVRRHRELHRDRRRKGGVPLVALVGYTNAGKSTLFNVLSKAGVIVEDKLFSTLDPVTRRIRFTDGTTILMTDTVGFINKLPPSIIAAFRTTLEELHDADLLLHVVDITRHDASLQHGTVEHILRDMGLNEKPVVTVLNKIDLVNEDGNVAKSTEEETRLNLGRPDFVLVSAVTGEGVATLADRIVQALAVSGGSWQG
ncbi:MAG: GTPase HflX [Dehalococcoidia bacterium]|nr:GTPase HflX [Dehalococcoidia bacterium]